MRGQVPSESGEHVVVVSLAVPGLAHPPHVGLEDWDHHLSPAELGRAVKHSAHELFYVHGEQSELRSPAYC